MTGPVGRVSSEVSFLLYGPDAVLQKEVEVQPDPGIGVEYVTDMEPFVVHQDYFSSRKNPDWIRIVVEGRQIKIFGINEEQQTEEFEKSLDGMIIPVVDVDELRRAVDTFLFDSLKVQFGDNHRFFEFVSRQAELRAQLAKEPAEAGKQVAAIGKILDRTDHLFTTLFEQLTPLETIEKVLGEEVYKQMQRRIPIRWKIPKENVSKLRVLLASCPSNEFADNGVEAEALLQRFQEEKDYLIEEEFIPNLIPITKLPLSGWPRVEKVKLALKKYFRIQFMVENVSKEMFRDLKRFKRSLCEPEREELLERLTKETGKEERLRIFDSLQLPLGLPEINRVAYLEVLLLCLPDENDFLLAPLDNLLQEEEDDEDDSWLQELDRTALSVLETECDGVNLRIVFRKNGREVLFGGCQTVH